MPLKLVPIVFLQSLMSCSPLIITTNLQLVPWVIDLLNRSFGLVVPFRALLAILMIQPFHLRSANVIDVLEVGA